jgi:acetyltransferase-like isoleucine patch superfamily enzyme
MKGLKQFVKDLIFRPSGIDMGPRSMVRLPRWVHNGERIRMGADCFIGRLAVLHPLVDYDGTPQAGRIEIGDGVYIGGFAQIHAMQTLRIGDGCVLSEHVYVSDIAHGLDPRKGPIMKQPLESKGPVTIGRRVFIGYGCSILPGVTLGDHCVVGTRSVVTRSFPPYSMVAGSPARLIRRFDPETGQWVPASEGDPERRTPQQ